MRLPLPLRARWERNLFVHFRVSPGPLRSELPPGLELDLFDGDAWITAIARMTRGPFPLPEPVLMLRRPHPELWLATPVVHDGEPGHYFLAYALPSGAVAMIARAVLGMPFVAARLTYTESPDGELRLRARRSSLLGDVALRARPARLPLSTRRSPLASFLLERYCAFGGGRDGRRLERLRFEHPGWHVVDAEVSEWNIPYLSRYDLPWGGAPDAVHIGAGLSVRLRDLHLE
jgi:uncharacterized protein YqjF (DUF2071 family)